MDGSAFQSLRILGWIMLGSIIFGFAVAFGAGMFVGKKGRGPLYPELSKDSKCSIHFHIEGYSKPGIICEDGSRWLFEDLSAPPGPDHSSKLVRVPN